MIISEVKEEELQHIFPFIRKTFDDTYRIHNSPDNMHLYLTKNLSDEQLSSDFENPNCLFYKGIENGELAGYLKLNTNDSQKDTSDMNAIEIERIYVDQSFQKMGLGAELVYHSIQVGKQFEKSYLWLCVWNKNENAIGFYKKMGFSIFDTIEFQLGDDVQTDYKMKIEL
jgi:ribosomal protein S18 acetylase RimI-like enzyme